MSRPLPSGTVTLLFTDIEGSSRLWDAHRAAMGRALAIHHEVVRRAIKDHSGVIVKDTGDGFFAAFSRAPDAITAALAAQHALSRAVWPAETGALRVRMALHTGPVESSDGDCHGPADNRVARIEALGHGGQILLSHATSVLVQDDLPDGVVLRDLGEQPLRGLKRPERIHQIDDPTLPTDFPRCESMGGAGCAPARIPHVVRRPQP